MRLSVDLEGRFTGYKGQIISERNCGVLIFSQNQQNSLTNFCRKGQLISKGNYTPKKRKQEMLILALANWGRNFSLVFWEN